VFDGYLWRMTIGKWMFSMIGVSGPPDLNGEYRGAIEWYSATDRTAESGATRQGFHLKFCQPLPTAHDLAIPIT
jgi:hypothetical protein